MQGTMKKRTAFLLLHGSETTGSATRGAAQKWFELNQLSDIKMIFLIDLTKRRGSHDG
jgi:hypothetical protein